MWTDNLESGYRGTRTNNILYLPSSKVRKIVIFCHGFPGTNRLAALREILTQQGIVLVEVGYRGDKNCEGKFSFFGSMDDIYQPLPELNNMFSGIETCFLGYSAGGLYVMNLIGKYGSIVDSVVLLNPALDPWIFSDPALMQTLWPIAQESLSLHEPGFYKNEIQLLPVRYNPFHFVGEFQSPITIVHSENDEVVSINTSKEFCRRWDSTNFVAIKNKPHHLDGDEPELIEALVNSAS